MELRPGADDGEEARGYRARVSTRRLSSVALRDVRPRDVRIAAMSAFIQIGGTLGASSHARSHGANGCWWASSCHAPKHVGALAFVLLAMGPVSLLVRRAYPRGVLLFTFAVTLIY